MYTLIVTSADIETIGQALDDLPYKKVYQLAQKLQAQINEQNVAAHAAATKTADPVPAGE